jgi:AraC family transcriptional regulator
VRVPVVVPVPVYAGLFWRVMHGGTWNIYAVDRRVIAMDMCVDDASAGLQVGAAQSHERVRYVIALLDAAVSQLDEEQAVYDTIVQAASLLRMQIAQRVAEGKSEERGRLIAWREHKVRSYIDNHIIGPILVSDLCVLVRLSESYFSRSFRRTFGESPHAFVLRRRLELAVQYMLQTDIPLSDIAMRCGFSDQAHLSRQFRRASGLTPSAWRRVSKAQDVSRTAWRQSREQMRPANEMMSTM